MGFYSLEPKKREKLVKEYLATKKRIRDNFLNERTGERELQQDLSRFFKPIIETQKETAARVTEELKPIREGIEQVPQQPLQQPLQQLTELGTFFDDDYASAKILHNKDYDGTFGVYKKGNNFYMGDSLLDYDRENYWIRENKFDATPGLKELIYSKNPDANIYDDRDRANYAKMLKLTNAGFRDNNPNNPPKSSSSYKYKTFVKPVIEEIREKTKMGIKGKGITIILPSDPNALIERFDLLMASKEAGNTGVRNELVAICDELRRQRVLEREEYRNFF